MEEQSVTNKEISQNITEASTGLNEINQLLSKSADDNKKGNEDLIVVYQTSEKVYKDSINVNSNTEELAKISNLLSESVQRFKL